MDEVHGICGVDAVKMISRTGTNYDTSENIKELVLPENKILVKILTKSFPPEINDSYFHAKQGGNYRGVGRLVQ